MLYIKFTYSYSIIYIYSDGLRLVAAKCLAYSNMLDILSDGFQFIREHKVIQIILRNFMDPSSEDIRALCIQALCPIALLNVKCRDELAEIMHEQIDDIFAMPTLVIIFTRMVSLQNPNLLIYFIYKGFVYRSHCSITLKHV